MKNKYTMEIETRYRTFKVKYLGPTNTKPSKVKIYDLRNNASVSIPYDHSFRDAQEIAYNYLLSKKISVDAMAMMDKDIMFLSKDFSKPLK